MSGQDINMGISEDEFLHGGAYFQGTGPSETQNQTQNQPGSFEQPGGANYNGVSNPWGTWLPLNQNQTQNQPGSYGQLGGVPPGTWAAVPAAPTGAGAAQPYLLPPAQTGAFYPAASHAAQGAGLYSQPQQQVPGQAPGFSLGAPPLTTLPSSLYPSAPLWAPFSQAQHALGQASSAHGQLASLPAALKDPEYLRMAREADERNRVYRRERRKKRSTKTARARARAPAPAPAPAPAAAPVPAASPSPPELVRDRTSSSDPDPESPAGPGQPQEPAVQALPGEGGEPGGAADTPAPNPGDDFPSMSAQGAEGLDDPFSTGFWAGEQLMGNQLLGDELFGDGLFGELLELVADQRFEDSNEPPVESFWDE